MSLKYEPASEPLRRYLFNGSRTFQSFEITDNLTLQYNFYGACGINLPLSVPTLPNP